MIQLTHIGEELLSRMLYESEEVRRAVCGSYISITRNNEFVPELRLNGCRGLSFDGAHKVDVAALNNDTNHCLPIEAKLGFDRLGKNEFEKRFLGECGTSHNNTRVKGSMISILERKLPKDCGNQNLSVSWQGRTYTVSPSWVLVARKVVVEKWKTLEAPQLSDNCRVVEFESLVEMYGTSGEFNSLVERLLSIDYFEEWQCDT